jgi:hypothetical protein
MWKFRRCNENVRIVDNLAVAVENFVMVVVLAVVNDGFSVNHSTVADVDIAFLVAVGGVEIHS